MTSDEPLLSVRLTAGYEPGQAILDGFDLNIARGEIVGLVGESGSGKSTVARVLLQLESFSGGWSQGSVLFEGRDLKRCKERELRTLRGRRISLVLQSPMTALNPGLRIESQLKEAWLAHASRSEKDNFEAVVSQALQDVHLPADKAFRRRYPGQISVGQAQRVLIAMAVLHRPALIIADEATSSLDPLTRVGVLQLFRNLNRRLGIAMLFISHDLPSVMAISDRVAILREGSIVECASPSEIVSNPSHSYTCDLVEAMMIGMPPTSAKTPRCLATAESRGGAVSLGGPFNKNRQLH
jgi:ABC-type glutathione transport system ATPase component